MLYPKNTQKKLDRTLFDFPSSEYRGAPFWAWNCDLTTDMLIRQIDYLKEMGFGGFHMHSRTGMAVPYLGERFMSLVKICVEKAREEHMLAWLYDEDRWPSGSAGGLVTKNPKHRARHLLFTPVPSEKGSLLGRYEITLDTHGCLSNYRLLGEKETGDTIWFAYLEIEDENPWYNNQSYVNTLDKKAIDEFIRITYETYKKAIGNDFGTIVPAIFTDEPQFTRKTTLAFASDQKNIYLPWTDDITETYTKAYGEDLIAHLPELIWELPDGKISTTRYCYHDHIAQRFAQAFADNCGAWCRANHLMLTGHMMEEYSLESQTAALGEAMLSYRAFDLPGIDILCDRYEFTTAKQAQSAVHQFGCSGMTSELYGVTNWDFDFRGHKLQGDWQAALGVTVRVPHLSWVSMEGEAKRDYPASINYQSPWYKEYPLIEDHFARLNTALTRGKPLVRVGVIHPVESYWLYWGPSNQTASQREQLEQGFQNITQWLLFGQIDFDFISEALLPEQCNEGTYPFPVGEMRYDILIIPGCQTLRSTTVTRLRDFMQQGGSIIIMGSSPAYIDAKPADGQLDFLEKALHIGFEQSTLLDALKPIREVDIRNESGARTNDLVTQLRIDGDNRWLFIARAKKPQTQDLSTPQHLQITIPGLWTPQIWNTLTREITPANTSIKDNQTITHHTLYMHDSLLLYLIPADTNASISPASKLISTSDPSYKNEGQYKRIPIALSEPNVLLLDMAEYSLDTEDFTSEEEILRIDNILRRRLSMPARTTHIAQPWVIEKETPTHFVRLRFTIHSDIHSSPIYLALENTQETTIRMNGNIIPSDPCGWYVDESIHKVLLPALRQGNNVLELRMPFGERSNLEWCYLLGDFGVTVDGAVKTITAPVREISFGNVVSQGFPFYGGNITYKLHVKGTGENLTIHVPAYRGALIGVMLDGVRVGSIAFDPYNFTFPNLSEGEHEIGLILFGTRINSFGTIHNCDSTCIWYGNDSWRTTGDQWSYEYVLNETGILKSPTFIENRAVTHR